MGQRLKTIVRETLFLLGAAALAGCGNGQTALPTPDINIIVTNAILQTSEASNAALTTEEAAKAPVTEELAAAPAELIVRYTETPETVVVLPTAQETGNRLPDIAKEASAEQEIISNIYLTAQPAELPTQGPVYSTPTPAGVGDKAKYVKQSPLDGTHVDADSEFDIEWFWTNVGTTTWTTDYTCRYFTGTDFTKPGKDRYPLRGTVPPNAEGSCIVDAVAPKEPGTYKMSVVLGNENDQNFTIVDLTIVVD